MCRKFSIIEIIYIGIYFGLMVSQRLRAGKLRRKTKQKMEISIPFPELSLKTTQVETDNLGQELLEMFWDPFRLLLTSLSIYSVLCQGYQSCLQTDPLRLVE